MSWMRDTYPDGPCGKCGSLVSVESFEYDKPEGKEAMLCDPCWEQEAEREKANDG